MQRTSPASPPHHLHAPADPKTQRSQPVMQCFIGMHCGNHGFLAGMEFTEQTTFMAGFEFHIYNYSK